MTRHQQIARLERWARIVAAANRPDIARELLEEAEQLRQEKAA